jgi:integrase
LRIALSHRSGPRRRIKPISQVLQQIRPVFGKLLLSDITAELIEEYLANRLRSRRRIKTKLGTYEKDILKPSTVHREYRVLNRILNVAVQKKRLAVNPCQSVEFPARLAGTTRKPHYLTAKEQALVEFFAPSHLKNVVVIMVEMGLRPHKELLPMRKEQIDLENRLVHLPESKTPSGIADMPMTAKPSKTRCARVRGRTICFRPPSRSPANPT